MKSIVSFLDNLRISIFDFKSYEKFMNMSFFRVILERILFVVLISLLYMFFLTEDIRSLKDFNNNKHVVFEDITYSNGILDIKNSPTLFKSNNFTLIGDTREDFETYRDYKNSVVLLRDSFIIKNGFNEFKVKYSEFFVLNYLLPKDTILDKQFIFLIIESIVNSFTYLVYIILPLSMIFNFFLLAFITSFFAYFLSIIIRFKVKFINIYKMILFAQGTPFLIISIYSIIAKINNINFLFPTYILEFLTLMVFLISTFYIMRNKIKKY